MSNNRRQNNSRYYGGSRTAPASPVARVRGGTPTKESERQRQEAARIKRVRKAAWRLVAVLVPIFLLIFGLRFRVDLYPRNFFPSIADRAAMMGSGGKKADLSGGAYKSSAPIGAGIAVLTDSSFSVYGGGLKEVRTKPHFMASPAMKVSGRYALIFDAGGKSASLETARGTLFSITESNYEEMVGGPVSCGAAARSGDFALSTNHSPLMSTVSVFSPAGEMIYRWSSADFFVTDLALSADGKRLAAVGLNAADGRFMATLTVLRVGYEESLCRIELPDFEPIALSYVQTGYLFLAGDQKSYVIDPHNFEAVELPVGGPSGGALTAFAFDYASGAAFFSQASDNHGVLTVYNTVGKRLFQNEVDIRAVGISLSRNRAAILGRDGAAAFSLGGSVVAPPRVQPGCRALLLRGASVYLIHNTAIVRV